MCKKTMNSKKWRQTCDHLQCAKQNKKHFGQSLCASVTCTQVQRKRWKRNPGIRIPYATNYRGRYKVADTNVQRMQTVLKINSNKRTW